VVYFGSDLKQVVILDFNGREIGRKQFPDKIE